MRAPRCGCEGRLIDDLNNLPLKSRLRTPLQAGIKMARIDKIAKIGGLISRPDLNGTLVRVVADDPDCGGPLCISAGRLIALKPANLTPAHLPFTGELAAGSTPEANIPAVHRARHEADVLIRPAPPWYDEDVPAEYASGDGLSNVFSDNYKVLLKEIYRGVGVDAPVLIEGRGPTTFSAFQGAALFCDLPMLHALGRRGADINATRCLPTPGAPGPPPPLPMRNTPLHLCLGSWLASVQRDPGGLPRFRTQNIRTKRRYLDTCKWLIGCGAKLGSGRSDDSSFTELRVACTIWAQSSSEQGKADAEALVELLLRHGATLTREDRECVDVGSRKILKELEGRHAGQPRPAPLCQCGSGLPLAFCHEWEGEFKGVPVHDLQPCPCGKKKLYGRCCKKRRYYWRETLLEVIPPPRFIPRSVCGSPEELETLKKLSADMGSEEKEKSNQRIAADSCKLFGDVADGLVESGECDPGFAYACRRCDFRFARPWRKRVDDVMPITRREAEVRALEWNALVDAYIAEGGDPRSKLEIEQQCKVGWTGRALLHACANPACARVEVRKGEFKACSKCKVLRFCGKACLRASWKKHHQRVCKPGASEPLLPSQAKLIEQVDAMMCCLQGDVVGATRASAATLLALAAFMSGKI